ncbi:MAG: diguanylate cyclase [Gammaproteobacteria bacterium]
MVNRYTLVLRALACLLWASLCVPAAAAVPALTVADAPFEQPAGYGWYGLLTAPGDTVEPQAVATSDDFRPATPDSINAGFGAKPTWARFALQWSPGRTHSLALVLPMPLIDDVELFVLDGGEVVQRVLTGDMRPYASRPFGYRGFAFELTPRPGRTVTYLLRLDGGRSALEVPLRLRETRTFRQSLSRENFWLGGFFGSMTALAVTVGLIFVRLRRPMFLFYSLYIVAFTLMMATVSGYGMMLLWPNAGGAQQYLPSVFVTLAIVSGLLFLDRFLDLSRWPRWRWPLGGVVVLAAIGCAMQVGGNSLGARAVIAAAIVLCPLVVVLCVRALRAGDRFAGYFLAGWTFYVIGVLAAALDMLGVVPHSPLSAYGLFIGALAEFVALTVAMAERMAQDSRSQEAQIARTNAELAELNQNLETIVRYRTHELEERNRELADLAIRDSLTGLYNHSASIELLEQILHQSQRYDFPVAVVMVDIDHFKRINDTHGHQVGDTVLERMAHTLVESLRDSDMVGRYGGEEFLIAMPHADATAAREFGERLLARARAIEVPRVGGEGLTISLGISVCHPYGQRLGAAEAIHRADEALYRSKRDGRDRLTVDNLAVVVGREAQTLGVP